MASVLLVALAGWLCVRVYGEFPQYDFSYFGPHNGYPYGRHGPYFPPRRLALEGAFEIAGGKGDRGDRIAGSDFNAGEAGSAEGAETAGESGDTRLGRPGFAELPGGIGKPGPTNAQSQSPVQKLPQPEVYVNSQDAVASSAVRTTDQYFYTSAPVGFDNITTNINGGYIPEYGVFSAPVPGIYSVNYHVQTKKGSTKVAHVDLTQNGELVNSAKAKGDCVTASNSAVLYLDQFDRLSVNGRKGTVIGCENNGFCSFSVTLVKPGNFNDQMVSRSMPMDKW